MNSKPLMVERTEPSSPVPTDLPALLDRLYYRYPSFLIDAVTDHEPGVRLTAIKNVTVNEEFFQGHFPGSPLMPGVLMIEALTQAAAVLILERIGISDTTRVFLQGVDNAKFRRQVVPGDRLHLDIKILQIDSQSASVRTRAFVDKYTVAEADLLLAIETGITYIDEKAIVDPAAQIGSGTRIGPYVTVGPNVKIGIRCQIGASTVIDGLTEIGDETIVYPMVSIGLAPQDLKYKGGPTRLTIGRQNTFREFTTINRGTEAGGGHTRIGDNNLFMANVHVAHDCEIGNNVILGNGATLGGHVSVGDFSTVSAYSGVHQFCRIGRHAFVGGYSVVTKDALPFAKSVGNRSRIYGLNTVGLVRRGFSGNTIAQLKLAFRYLLMSKLNTARALEAIQGDVTLTDPEVHYLVKFIKSSSRGVILKRPLRGQVEEMLLDD